MEGPRAQAPILVTFCQEEHVLVTSEITFCEESANGQRSLETLVFLEQRSLADRMRKRYFPEILIGYLLRSEDDRRGARNHGRRDFIR